MIDVTSENVAHEVSKEANTQKLDFSNEEEAEVVGEEVVSPENEIVDHEAEPVKPLF